MNAISHSPRNILLIGITGAVASAWLPARIYSLRKYFAWPVHVMMTRSATDFITPYSMELLSGNKVFVDAAERTEAVAVPHVVLPAQAAAFVIMPATAAILASCVAGACDNLISLAVCATPTGTPVIFVPSMNPVMWESAAVQRNVASLRQMGYHVIDPGPGEEVSDLKTAFTAMASHEIVESLLSELLTGSRSTDMRSNTMTNIYQVGGLDEPELCTLVDKLKKTGVQADILANHSNRFSLAPKEFAVQTDEKGVLGLLSDHRVNLGSIRWEGSMRDTGDEEATIERYPDRMPLTPSQVRTLESSGTELYRVGNVSYHHLQRLVDQIKQDGMEAEIVKVAGNRFVGDAREFTLKTSEKGILGLLADRNISVGIC